MLEAFRAVAAEDGRQRREVFSVGAFADAFPAAAGLVSPALNVRVVVRDDDGDIYHPSLDEDSCDVAVSLATPPRSATTAAALVPVLYAAVLHRDNSARRGRGDAPPTVPAPAPEGGVPVAAPDGIAAEAELAAERAVAAWAADLTLHAAAGPAPPPAVGDGAARAAVGHFSADAAAVEAAVGAVLRAAAAWVTPSLRLLPGGPRRGPPGGGQAAAVAALEVPRCRMLRACVDGDVATAARRTAVSAARRLARRGATAAAAAAPAAVAALYGGDAAAMERQWRGLAAAAEALPEALPGGAGCAAVCHAALGGDGPWEAALLRGEAAASLWEAALRGAAEGPPTSSLSLDC